MGRITRVVLPASALPSVSAMPVGGVAITTIRPPLVKAGLPAVIRSTRLDPSVYRTENLTAWLTVLRPCLIVWVI